MPLGVIFGGGNKLTAEGPFLDLLIRFRDALRLHRDLLVVGYSFRDDHVNHCILTWLLSPQARRLTIVERPGFVVEHHAIHAALDEKARERVNVKIDPCGAEEGMARYLSGGPKAA
jgi:hypothetical protein